MRDSGETAVFFGQKSSLTKLAFCRGLLNDLDPDRPPLNANPKEFEWQYRALEERVNIYSERLAGVGNPPEAQHSALRKAATAIELSLGYFEDVLAPKES